MNKTIPHILFLVLVVTGPSAHAQATKSIELKPIQIQGPRYYYNFRKLRGGAFALQAPLQSLEDEEVNRHYRNFNTLVTVGRMAFIAPLTYFLSVLFGHTHTSLRRFQRTYWTLLSGATLINVGTEIAGRSQVRKAVDRYNLIILKGNSVGMQIEQMPNHQRVVGLGISRRFK